MSGHRCGAGARLRAVLSGLVLFAPLLAPTPASALDLGELRVESAPGQAYRAVVPVTLDDLDRQGYLIVSAYASVSNTAGGESRVPLTIQRSGTAGGDIHLLGREALPDGTRVQVTASSVNARLSRTYVVTQGQAVAPPQYLPPPPAAAPYIPEAAPSPALADNTAPASPEPPAISGPLPPAAPETATVVPAPRPLRQRNDTGIYIRPVVEFGYEYGGDKLVEVECLDTNDNTVSTPSLRAGSGLVGGLGGHVRPERQSPFDLRLTFDYKYQAACNSVNLQRFRFTLLPSYRFGPRQHWWAGAGLLYETGIKFDGKNLPVQGAPGETLGKVDFDDAVGGTVQLGWWFVALDYNFLKYSKNGAHVNANSVGLLFTYGFDFY